MKYFKSNPRSLIPGGPTAGSTPETSRPCANGGMLKRKIPTGQILGSFRPKWPGAT